MLEEESVLDVERHWGLWCSRGPESPLASAGEFGGAEATWWQFVIFLTCCLRNLAIPSNAEQC